MGGGSSGSVSSSDETGTGKSANSTNSNKNNGNHRSLSALSTSSVLAHRFVPQNLMEINTRPVARILDTRQQLLDEAHDGTNNSSLVVETLKRVFFGLTAEHFPGPFCGGPNQACHQPPRATKAPRATKVTEEPHHARQLASTRGSPHIPVSSMASGRDESGTTLIGKKKCLACLQQKQAHVSPPHMSRLMFKQELVEIRSISVPYGLSHPPLFTNNP